MGDTRVRWWTCAVRMFGRYLLEITNMCGSDACSGNGETVSKARVGEVDRAVAGHICLVAGTVWLSLLADQWHFTSGHVWRKCPRRCVMTSHDASFRQQSHRSSHASVCLPAVEFHRMTQRRWSLQRLVAVEKTLFGVVSLW